MQKQTLIIWFIGLLALVLGLLFHTYQRNDFEDSQGNGYQWRTLRDQVVVVNYFAEWCAPCLKEIPELNTLHAWSLTQDDVTVMAVSYDHLSVAEVNALRAKYDIRFPVIVDTGVDFPVKAPQYLPATFFVNAGETSPPLLGEQTFETFVEAVNQIR